MDRHPDARICFTWIVADETRFAPLDSSKQAMPSSFTGVSVAVMSKMDENQMASLTDVLTCEASAPFHSANAFDHVMGRLIRHVLNR